MTKNLAKFLPIVVGLGLGYLLFHPPDALRSLGVVAYLVMGGVVLLLLVGFVAVIISGSLPADVGLVPLAEGTLPPELRSLGERFEALGFVAAGSPLEVALSPPAIMASFVHERERTYGNAFRTGTIPAKTSIDFVSILEGDRGGLTTNADPAGAALPAAPGSLRQVFKGASLEQLWDHHRKGVAYLRQQGLACRALSPDTLVPDLKASLARQRKGFFSSPIRNTVVTIWRAATHTTPHLGALVNQRQAQQQIRELLAGRRGW